MRVGTPFEFGRVGFLVRLRRAGFCSALLSYVFASAVVAQEATFEPLVEARLRNEHVDQEAIAKPADAVTLRVRAGVEANLERWSALVEGQGTVALLDHYFDGLNGAENRPLVADPPDAALYRAQIGYKDADLAVTVGRQEIVLDEQRPVVGAPIRIATPPDFISWMLARSCRVLPSAQDTKSRALPVGRRSHRSNSPSALVFGTGGGSVRSAG